jgi:hypothetical protein
MLLRFLRRLLLLIGLSLAPLYLLSLTEDLQVPPGWRAIDVGDSHAEVRARLRGSGLADSQCEWIADRRSVRCTLPGDHHAAGVVVVFDGPGRAARVAGVRIHEPVYTGPFHLHARLRDAVR